MMMMLMMMLMVHSGHKFRFTGINHDNPFFLVLLQPKKCTRHLLSDSSHKFNQIWQHCTGTASHIVSGGSSLAKRCYSSTRRTRKSSTRWVLPRTLVHDIDSMTLTQCPNISTDVKESFPEYSYKHIIWCQGELLYARFKVPASSGSISALVSHPKPLINLDKLCRWPKQLDFRSLPHGLRTMWMPRFGFFSGINNL